MTGDDGEHTLVDFNGRDLDYVRLFQIEIRDICHPIHTRERPCVPFILLGQTESINIEANPDTMNVRRLT